MADERTIGELLAAVASEASEHPFVGSPGQKVAWDEIKARLDAAQGGLLRALDFRTASPEGLTIKGEVRGALRRSGFTGPMGAVGDLVRPSFDAVAVADNAIGLFVEGLDRVGVKLSVVDGEQTPLDTRVAQAKIHAMIEVAQGVEADVEP